MLEKESLQHFEPNLDLIPIEILIKPSMWEEITGESSKDSVFYVVIPAHNEEKTIRAVLNNMLTQELPSESQYIIHAVSNGSTDNTEIEIGKAIEDMEWNMAFLDSNASVTLQLTSVSEANKCIALNVAREMASSDIVIHVDADTYPTANAVAKIYALMKSHPNCAAASVMPRRINNDASTLHNMQDYYDSRTRENGAIIGKFLAYRPQLIPPFPTDIGSEDSWLEFTAIDRYGEEAVKFLGQDPESDVAAFYHGTNSFKEYFEQLMRWESEFRKLMTKYPELWSACKLANRIENPHGIFETVNYIHNNYPDLPVKDKMLMHALLVGVRKIVKKEVVANRFGKGASWVSPTSDRK